MTKNLADRDQLCCYGCAHAAALKPFPGEPSGERPCQFCIRNPREPYKGDEGIKTWYDGSEPVSVPMDCYHSLAMSDQILQWEKSRKSKTPNNMGRESVQNAYSWTYFLLGVVMILLLIAAVLAMAAGEDFIMATMLISMIPVYLTGKLLKKKWGLR